MRIARSTKHGHKPRDGASDLYVIWCGIKQRCYDPACEAHKDYGARGIAVCDRWKDDFATFATDMGERPAGLSLERRDNNLGYNPDNCYWATAKQQANNRRSNVRVPLGSAEVSLKDYALAVGVCYRALHYQHRRNGLPLEAAVARVHATASRRAS